MKELTYCPKCGETSLVWDNSKQLSCETCDFVLFHNCAAAVAVIIKHGDEIMLTRRNQEPKKGKLDLAGGFVDPCESAETTCERELYEELKLEIDKKQLKILSTQPNIYHYKGIDYNTLDIFFEYHLTKKTNLHLELSEISEVVWLNPKNLKIEDIAFDSQKRFFEKYIENL
ncbi:MAG: NUDIX domain-containing protein [Bergeyella zoohelcum]|nr:NUDIX domain-containing protein [Bergeyella zoohelcum]